MRFQIRDKKINISSTLVLFTIACSFLYFSFAYDLVRTDHAKLLSLYAALCFFSYKIVRGIWNIPVLIAIAIIFRVIFIVALPNLSQDFYRFIWDGELMGAGVNPYLSTPLSFDISAYTPFHNADQLVAGMGALNASHFTNYPPICQFIFYLASWFYDQWVLPSVIVMRTVIIVADIGTIYFGRKLLLHLNLHEKNIFWFALNPLVIIELTGNLHFEGVMIFFCIWSLYLLYKRKWFWSAIILGISISTKLIPLMFLPLLYQWFVRKNGQFEAKGIWPLMRYYLVVGTTTLLIFLPFYSSEFINNYSQTVGLWFQKFEFNASIYYLLRELGFAYYGYNNIAYFGPLLAISVILFVTCLSFFGRFTKPLSLLKFMLFALSFYLFTTTTLHPWYLTTLIAFCVFTKYKFPVVWGLIVILSYLAYTSKGFYENPWILILEYSIVFGFLTWEIFGKKSPSQNISIKE